MLWHLAERWGRVHPDGVVIPLPLNHQRLADLVGAHRPSVTTAMGELNPCSARSAARTTATRRLHGAPPEKLALSPPGGGAGPDAAQEEAGTASSTSAGMPSMLAVLCSAR